VDIKTLLGTLSFKPQLSERTNTSRYWLYVDGRIVATRVSPSSDSNSLNAIEILLVPGEYKVEVGVTTPDAENSRATFPFVFRSQRVQIVAGQSKRVELNVEAASYDDLVAVFPFVEPSSEWFEAWVKRVDDQIQAFQKDPTQQAILDVYNMLKESPPVRPSVYINLPAERGGGREFDAEEVRLMVGWLKRYRSDTLAPLPAPFVDRMPEDMRLRYEQVLKVITNYQNYVSQFETIATRLDAAKNS
jgi:hypothetical protein